MYRRSIVLCISAFTLLTLPVASHITIPGDAELLGLAMSARTEFLTAVIWLLTFISSAVPGLLITLAITGFELRRAGRFTPGALWATIAYVGAAACNIVLRISIGRLPPQVDYIPNLLPELRADFQRFAYPSGHAGVALLVYSAIVVLAWSHVKQRRWLLAGALLVILGVGFGRVYLGVHWPTDVIAGYLLSGSWLGVGLMLRTSSLHRR